VGAGGELGEGGFVPSCASTGSGVLRTIGCDQDPTAWRDLALSYFRLGIIKNQLGPKGNEVLDAYQRAIALLTPTDSNLAADRATTILLAKAANNLSLEQMRKHDWVGARPTLESARDRLQALLAITPVDRAAQSRWR